VAKSLILRTICANGPAV